MGNTWLLSDGVLDWVIQHTDQHADVTSVNRVQGGTSSAVYRIEISGRYDKSSYILRQFDQADWLKQEPDLALHEAASLRLAEETAVKTPALLAFDETGHACGLPTVLMTELKGEVVLEPEYLDDWIWGMAHSLAAIHQTSAADFPWPYRSYMDASRLGKQTWSSDPGIWDEVIAVVQTPPPVYDPVFIHRDYHPGNVLWQDKRVSGVVDWVNACRGPAGADLGHCRLNLAQLHGKAAADMMLAAYSQCAGYLFQYEPYWDLVSLTDILFGPPSVYEGWTAAGVAGLTDQIVRDRLDEYAAGIIRSLKG
ncbi:phosphotransferase family protein [Paenibacillus protaetiae]|uniref:phosphotransferase family protein n=1 Tax=Paenibacillus protaetiae TaxID=2509456 RepID=UPI0013E9A3A0|nr:aminoglycoside phosphotransferase family protein [Paenibacillus protaetiae]